MKRLTTALAVFALGFTAWASAPARAQDKIVWDIAIYGPPRSVTVPIETVAKYIDEKSNGRFTFKLHYSESIAPAKSVLDSIKINAIHGGLVAYGYAPGKAPLHVALDLPYLPVKDINGWRKLMEAFYGWEPARKELARWNAIAFYATLLPPYEFMGSGKPPTTLEDWKGMRVRALGPHGDAMRTVGAVPTSVPAPEVYTGLERGTFQAASVPFSYAFGAYKLHQVSTWYTYGMQLGVVHNSWVFNKTAYDKLPAEFKKLLEDVREAQYEAGIAAFRAADEKFIPEFDKAGLTRIAFTPQLLAAFQAKAGRPLWDEWVKANEGKIPAKAALDFILKHAQ